MDIRKRKSQKQEKRVAKELDGSLTPASGALWGAKGDVRSTDFLIECKTTDKSYYPLTSAVWCKISKEAVADSIRIPVMCIEIQNESYAVYEKTEPLKNGDIFNLVTKKSFRVKQFDSMGYGFIPEAVCYMCTDESWQRQIVLEQIKWEDFIKKDWSNIWV